jgi:short-subunit dehydrogenase
MGYSNSKFQNMQQMKGKVVLITGGASGIGKIMVSALLARKAKVIIWDINTAEIEKTILEFSALGHVVGFTVDISNLHQIQETALKVTQEIGVVDVLINNAGIVAGKYFHEHSTSDILKTMEINASAPMLISKLFLPGMLAKNAGHICNIASSGGLISNPKMSVYAGSKWALIGWSDSLRLEMKLLKKSIYVTTIMPYYIHTGMFDGVQSKIPILDPRVAALAIIKAIEQKKRMVTIPGYIYRLTKLGQGLLSINAFDWFAGTALGIYKTMEHFTGRKNN